MALRCESFGKSMKKSRLAFVIPSLGFRSKRRGTRHAFSDDGLGRTRSRIMTCVMTKLCEFANSSLRINGLPPNIHWQGSGIMPGHMVCTVS
jgi:hypothetical protein